MLDVLDMNGLERSRELARQLEFVRSQSEGGQFAAFAAKFACDVLVVTHDIMLTRALDPDHALFMAADVVGRQAHEELGIEPDTPAELLAIALADTAMRHQSVDPLPPLMA